MIPFEWIIQAAIAVFMVAFLIQVNAFWTVLYLSVCVYAIMAYGLGVKIDGGYQTFRIWITTGSVALVIHYLSNVLFRTCNHGEEPDVGEEKDHDLSA